MGIRTRRSENGGPMRATAARVIPRTKAALLILISSVAVSIRCIGTPTANLSLKSEGPGRVPNPPSPSVLRFPRLGR